MNKKFLEKLIAIQNELQVDKGEYNAFANFKYRTVSSILGAVKPLLKDQGLLMTMGDEILSIDGRFYIQATVKVTDGENTVREQALAREPEHKTKMDDAQVTGTSSSYARKYALGAMFLIDDNKDVDIQNNTKKTEPKTTTEPLEVKEIDNLDFDFGENVKDDDGFFKAIEMCKSIDDLKVIWDSIEAMKNELIVAGTYNELILAKDKKKKELNK